MSPSPPPSAPAAAPKKGEPCCDVMWCMGQEDVCAKSCDRQHRPGSRTWKACHNYCSHQLPRCTACCRAHKVPNCEPYYCFGE